MCESAICTIITKSYLPYARTLASSLALYHPDVHLYVLLADRIDGYFDPSLENFKFIYLEDLPHTEEIEQMCFYYNAFELCCALRGILHEYMFERTNAQKWLFLDSDIMIYHPLDVIFEQLKNYSILLTPHISIATRDDGKDFTSEINYLKNGVYNAGFLGMRRTDTSRRFISWFKERLASYCFNDYANQDSMSRGLFVDQLWLNLVPFYFKEVGICLQAGINLGHWNIFDRTFSKDKFGNITVDGEPVLFIHFSGWDINNIDLVSKYRPSSQIAPPFWTELSKPFQDSLLSHGYESCRNFPYAFNFFHNGEEIAPEMRHKYYSLIGSADIEAPFSNQLYDRLISEQVNNSPAKVTRSARVFSAFKRNLKRLVNYI
jgi:hypothetical protein